MPQHIHNQLVSKIWTAFLVFLLGITGIVTADEVPGEEKKFNAGDLIIDGMKKNFEGNYKFKGGLLNSQYFNYSKTKVVCFLQNIETREVLTSSYATLK